MKIVKVLLLPALLTASLFADCNELLSDVKSAQSKADKSLDKPDVYVAYQSMSNSYRLIYNECMNALRHAEIMENNEELRILLKTSRDSSVDSASSTYVDPYQ